ncbi:MAG TPA: ABC transporter substrate-binding protein [Burkholderiales bacterium]|nr:ABC transporter substrate-binding protein [Burkholderiales bacterium]
MIRKIAAALGTLMFMAGAANVAYAQTAPDALVKSTVDEVLGVIKTSKDRRVLVDVVEKKVLPHFDFQAMTRLAVGRFWQEASPAQQKSLENAFRGLLVTTYTQALSQSATSDQTVEVRPVAAKAADEDITVKTFVKDPSRKPLSIDYRLAKAGNAWKVYDVVVENLSLVTNYRSSFNAEISKSGIDGLIKALEAKNKRNSEG